MINCSDGCSIRIADCFIRTFQFLCSSLTLLIPLVDSYMEENCSSLLTLSMFSFPMYALDVTAAVYCSFYYLSS